MRGRQSHSHSGDNDYARYAATVRKDARDAAALLIDEDFGDDFDYLPLPEEEIGFSEPVESLARSDELASLIPVLYRTSTGVLV